MITVPDLEFYIGKELKNRSNSELSFEIALVTHKKQVNQISKVEIHKNLTKHIERLVLSTFKTTAISHTNSPK